MSLWDHSTAILRKDVQLERRTRERLIPMIFFVLVVLLVFNFAFELGGENLVSIGPGVLWVGFVFASTLGLNRTFSEERHNDALDALRLAPLSGPELYLGKMAGNFLFLIIIESVGLPLFALFFNVAAGWYLLPLGLVLFLGSLVLAAVGTLFAAVADQSRLREFMLPLLLLPVIVPALISCVEATAVVLGQGRLSPETPLWPRELWPHIQILAAYAVVFTTLSLMLFDYVVEE